MKKLLKTIWIGIYPALLYSACQVAVLFIFYFEARFFSELLRMDVFDIQDLVQQHALILTVAAGCLAMPFLFLFVHLDNRKYGSYVKPQAPVLDYVMAALGGVGLAVVLNVLISLTGIAQSDPGLQSTNDAIQSTPKILALLSVGGIVPLVEELVFRLLLYRRVRIFYGMLPAMVASSVIFGIYHGNITQGIYATLLGLFLSYVFEKTRKSFIPVLVHMSANIVVTLLSWVTEPMSGDITEVNFQNVLFGAGVLLFLITCLVFTVISVMYFIRKRAVEE